MLKRWLQPRFITISMAERSFLQFESHDNSQDNEWSRYIFHNIWWNIKPFYFPKVYLFVYGIFACRGCHRMRHDLVIFTFSFALDHTVNHASVSVRCWLSYLTLLIDRLTHWGRYKMDAISQTTCSSAFSWMKMFEFRLKFHWRLFLRVQFTIIQHCFW